jgi:hypothetical protein
MMRITKYASEEFFRYHDFRAWLNGEETLTSCGVTVRDAAGVDVTAVMISNAAGHKGTQVRYCLKAGGARGTRYVIAITVETSNGQRFEDRLELVMV